MSTCPPCSPVGHVDGRAAEEEQVLTLPGRGRTSRPSSLLGPHPPMWPWHRAGQGQGGWHRTQCGALAPVNTESAGSLSPPPSARQHGEPRAGRGRVDAAVLPPSGGSRMTFNPLWPWPHVSWFFGLSSQELRLWPTGLLHPGRGPLAAVDRLQGAHAGSGWCSYLCLSSGSH